MLLAIAVLIFLFLLNGIFAMSELAMMTSRRSRLQEAASAGNRGAKVALQLSEEPTRFLSTVQVGITLIGILSGAYAEKAISAELRQVLADIPSVARYSEAISLASVVLAVTYFSLVLGELVPKRLALAFPETIASLISRPLNTLSVIAALPVKLLTRSTEAVLWLLRVDPPAGDDVSEEDVRALVGRAAATGVFTGQEHMLFQRIMRIGDLDVRDLMVPRTAIVYIEEKMPMEVVRLLVGTEPHSHFPVCRGGLDNLIGVVHIKDLMAHGLLAGADFEVSEVAQAPLFVPETMPALKLLDQFKGSRTHVAFVVDEYGATLGLLTLNDLVAALVGDIGRRGDGQQPRSTVRADGSWLLDGRLSIHDAISILKMADATDRPDANTVAGLVLARLGHIPREGESVTWGGWTFEVVDMDGTRVDQVLATKIRMIPEMDMGE